MDGPQPEKLTVMVVDQNKPVHSLVRSVLRDLGFREIVSAMDCVGRLEQFERRRVDLVITHYGGEAFTGSDLVQRVCTSETSSNPFVPVVMVTSQANRDVVVAARDVGVNEFIAKPFTANDLGGHILELLSRPRAFVRAESYFGSGPRRR